MRKETIEYREFPPLDEEDLGRYQQLGDLLRVFEITVIYNFRAADKGQRESLVTEMKNFIEGQGDYYNKGGYDLLHDILGTQYVCPLCPGMRICTLCEMVLKADGGSVQA